MSGGNDIELYVVGDGHDVRRLDSTTPRRGTLGYYPVVALGHRGVLRTFFRCPRTIYDGVAVGEFDSKLSSEMAAANARSGHFCRRQLDNGFGNQANYFERSENENVGTLMKTSLKRGSFAGTNEMKPGALPPAFQNQALFTLINYEYRHYPSCLSNFHVTPENQNHPVYFDLTNGGRKCTNRVIMDWLK
ncbi:hypothetical protein WA026_000926 [Henosepilachna vigintioctopunctata]|uniref:Uncharacterized protein n=1 Tax=Henosepilachna vigintioctopunctata TaxID=420089 RepID=A0AAW1V7H5_9CUCU